MGFSDEVTAFFESLGFVSEPYNDLPFDYLYLPAKRLVVHCISMTDFSYITAQRLVQISEIIQDKNLKIIHLSEYVWRKKTAIVTSRLRALVGISQRIGARQTQAQRIDKPTLDAFLVANHLQSTTNAKFKYGLMLGSSLVAGASFSGGRNIVREGVPLRSYELIRFANICDCTVVGGLDKLLQAFIRDQQPEHIMTYADRDWSNGESYERLGFVRTATTPPQVFNIESDNLVRVSANNTLSTLIRYDIKIWNTGNYKYEKIIY